MIHSVVASCCCSWAELGFNVCDSRMIVRQHHNYVSELAATLRRGEKTHYVLSALINSSLRHEGQCLHASLFQDKRYVCIHIYREITALTIIFIYYKIHKLYWWWILTDWLKSVVNKQQGKLFFLSISQWIDYALRKGLLLSCVDHTWLFISVVTKPSSEVTRKFELPWQ